MNNCCIKTWNKAVENARIICRDVLFFRSKCDALSEAIEELETKLNNVKRKELTIEDVINRSISLVYNGEGTIKDIRNQLKEEFGEELMNEVKEYLEGN